MKSIALLVATAGAVRFVENHSDLLNVVQADAAAKADPPGYLPLFKNLWNKENPHPGFEAGQHGFEGQEGIGAYERVLPERYGGPGSGDDQFMHSVIKNYAVEVATPEGTPTGQFVMKKFGTKQLAYEVLETHLGLKGKEAKDYMKKYFDKTWDHFDTADQGSIEVERMSPFMRYFTGNMQINLD